jgi:hypothetical protein
MSLMRLGLKGPGSISENLSLQNKSITRFTEFQSPHIEAAESECPS